MKYITTKLIISIFVFATAFFVMPSLFALANNNTAEDPKTCETCEKDPEGNVLEVVVDESVTVDFNTDVPTCVGDADLCAFFKYEKPDPSDPSSWNAIFDLGGKRLLVTNNATISTKRFPEGVSTQHAPGIDIRTTCDIVVEEGSSITVNPRNADGGDIFLMAGRSMTINGTISSIVDATQGVPGHITLSVCCGTLTTGSASRIIMGGNDWGVSPVDIVAEGNIILTGLIDSYQRGRAVPVINVISFGGTVSVDGTADFGIEDDTQRRVSGGITARSIRDKEAGEITIRAKGDVSVIGNTLLPDTHAHYGTLAVKGDSNSAEGGVIDVRSLEGSIIAEDRAFDNANRFNGDASITLLARHDVHLSVSDSIAKKVVDSDGGQDQTGGTNTIRSYGGSVEVDTGAIVSASLNSLISCSVVPADAVQSDDSGACSPVRPQPRTSASQTALAEKIQTYKNGALVICFGEEPPPENTQPIITVLGLNPLIVIEGDTFTDPGATADDEEDGDVTSDIVIGGDTVHTNIPGTYVITYDVADSQGLAADQKTRTVIIEEKPTHPACSDGSDNDLDDFIDQHDPACHTDGDPEHEESYNPDTNNENSKPVITLLGANSLDIVLNGPYTDSGATAFDSEDGDITHSIAVGGDTVAVDVLGNYLVTYNVVDSLGVAADQVTRTIRIIEEPPKPQCSDTLDNDGDEKTDAHDPACHTDGDPEHEESYNPDTNSENSKPVLTLLGDNPLTISTGNGYLESGATAFDQEDGIIPSEEIVAGGDTVNPTIVGSYIRTYNVMDSQGLAADEITRAVYVIEKQAVCSDNLDNDMDGKIDEHDAGCYTDGDVDNPNSYDPADGDENAKPVITILGSQTVSITEGDGYTDEGATAFDEEDGVITEDIVMEHNVNTGTPGAYIITYNVVDSLGVAADQVTRAVAVQARQTTGGGGGVSSGGNEGGNGGGGTTIFLEITNEKITLNEEGTAVVTWDTNLQATSMVVYDFVSHGTPASPATHTDYALATSKSTSFVTSHSVTVYGLLAGRAYYFRPYSDRSDDNELGIELTINPPSTVEQPQVSNIVGAPVPCTEYLTSYIKLGAANNSDDVRKLEMFLNTFEGFNLSVDGSYDQQDFEAVRVFQDRYFDDILAPWGHTKTTGYVFYTTRKKINEIYCKSVFPLTSEQQNEVDEFRAFLEQFQQGGIPGEVDTSVIGQEKIEEGLEEKKLAGLPDAPLTKQPGILAQLFGASFGDRSRVIGIVLVAFAGIIGIASILLVSRKSDK